MRERRGTTDQTLYNYSIPIRGLIRRIGGDPNALDARRLRQFVLEQSKDVQWSAQRCRTALRMFLRFLIAEGRCRAGLLGAIPVVAHWRLAAHSRDGDQSFHDGDHEFQMMVITGSRDRDHAAKGAPD
jgi:hypothetical protein